MTIKVGESIPSSVRLRIASPGSPREVSADDIFGARRVVLFAVPGAFTPACSKRHVPAYMKSVNRFEALGVDMVACISVNDVFVMRAWGQELGVGDKIIMLSDSGGLFTKEIGLENDPIGFGLGVRSKRYALVAEDARVRYLAVEDDVESVEVSAAKALLVAIENLRQ